MRLSTTLWAKHRAQGIAASAAVATATLHLRGGAADEGSSAQRTAAAADTYSVTFKREGAQRSRAWISSVLNRSPRSIRRGVALAFSHRTLTLAL